MSESEQSLILLAFLEAHARLEESLQRGLPGQLEGVADKLAGCLMGGGRIFACGNGGSLADAMHFVEELTGRFRDDRPPLAAIALADPTALTCIANDFGFDSVFSRQVEALGQAGDVLLLLTTSGRSPNLLRAAEAARNLGMVVIGLVGRGGGPLKVRLEMGIDFPGDTSDRIQELHMLSLHALVEAVESRMQPHWAKS